MSAAAATNSNKNGGIDNVAFVVASDEGSSDERRRNVDDNKNTLGVQDELDICEVDYERDPTDDDSDDQDGNNNDDDISIDLQTTGKSRCCAEAAYNCSIFSKALKVEVEELKAGISSIQCPSPRQLCTLERLAKRVPIIKWLPQYSVADLQGDLLAGFTVGLTVLPQSIAYASLANLPAQYGLYSAFIGSLVYVPFGTSKDITLGPSAIMALLTATFATSPIANDPTYAIILGLFTGVAQLAMYLLYLGVFIIDFVPFPVMKGFTTAAAITIALSQVKSWWGLQNIPRDFMSQLAQTIVRLPETRLYDFLLGCGCIFFIVLFRKLKEIQWKRRYRDLPIGLKILKKTIWLLGIARNVIVIICASVLAYALYSNGINAFTLTGSIPPGIPPFRTPSFSVHDPATNVTYTLSDIAQNINVGFAITPIIGFLEAMSIGKPYARKFNYRIDPNQELLPYGIAHVLGAFVSGFPVCGTFSRTALNAASGVRTPAGGIVTGVLVLLALQFMTPLFFYIPAASLAVVIILAVVDTLTVHKVWVFWRTNKIDVLLWLVTVVCSFVISIAYGVFVGMGLALVLLILDNWRPQIKIKDITVGEQGEKILIVSFNTGLSYPSAEFAKNKIISAAIKGKYTLDGSEIRGMVIDASTIARADPTTVQNMREMLEFLNKKNIAVVFCNLQKRVEVLFRRSRPKYFTTASDVRCAIDTIISSAGISPSFPFREGEMTTERSDSELTATVVNDSIPDSSTVITINVANDQSGMRLDTLSDDSGIEHKGNNQNDRKYSSDRSTDDRVTSHAAAAGEEINDTDLNASSSRL